MRSIKKKINKIYYRLNIMYSIIKEIWKCILIAYLILHNGVYKNRSKYFRKRKCTIYKKKKKISLIMKYSN